MTPKQLRQELVNAYQGHDREGFDRALDRMEGLLTYTGPVDTTRTARKPHGSMDGDLCPECGWTCNVCACEAPAWESCTRNVCLCESAAQRSVCCFRRAD